MPQSSDFVDFLLTCVGWGYKVDGFRCNGLHHTADCSGFVVLGANHVGVNGGHFPCTDAENIAADMIAAKTTMSIAQARATKGALLEVQFTPTHHHIAVSLGDGRTVEAYDTAKGVIIYHVEGRPWSVCGTLPGMTGFNQPPSINPGPTSPQEARDMGFPAIVVPGSHVQNKAPWLNRYPFVGSIVDAHGNVSVCGFNGARITNTDAQGKLQAHPAFGMSVWQLGFLQQPIESFSLLFEDGPGGAHVGSGAVIPGVLVGLAADGGSFPIHITVDYI